MRFHLLRVNLKHFPFLLSFLIGSFFLRFPFIQKELPPFQFCDESFFASDVKQMLDSKFPIAQEFRSGNLNSLPTYAVGLLLRVVGKQLNIEEIIVLGRIIMPMILGSATCFIIYTIAYLWTRSIFVASLVALLWLTSPYILSQSLIWYPDSYVFFFSALVLLDLSLILRNEDLILKKHTLIKSAGLIAAGTSIKYNFLIFAVPYIVILYRQSLMGRKQHQVIDTDRFISKLKFCIVASGSFFAVFNYSIFLNPIDFLRGLNSNRKIYQVDFERITGGMTYLWNALTLPWGLIGLLTLIVAVLFLVKENRLLIHMFITPIFLYLFIGGLNQQVVVRNINIVLPFLLVPILYLAKKCQQNFKLIVLYCVLLSLVVIQNSLISKENYIQLTQPDSTKVVMDQAKSLIPSQELVGINLGCSGPTPIESLGYSVLDDPQMEKRLNYYLFTSYYQSILFGYYSQGNVSQIRNLKDAHFYFYNHDLKLFSSGPTRSLSSFVPNGYKIIKIFRGNGPDFILIGKG